VAYAPPNASKEQINELSALARSYRAGESAGGALPNGADLRFRGVEGSLPDVLGSIRYDDEQMAARFLAMFTKLGTTETGSRALGQTLVDFFALGQEAVAKQYADTTLDCADSRHVSSVADDIDNANWSGINMFHTSVGDRHLGRPGPAPCARRRCSAPSAGWKPYGSRVNPALMVSPRRAQPVSISSARNPASRSAA
jgi:hypothetical protein